MNANHSGIVDSNTQDFPVLAVNVLDRLGYQVSRASKQLDQVLAVERLDEKVGRDWWHHEYRVVLRWQPTSGDTMFVTIDIEERKGAGTKIECQQRCERILAELRQDARLFENAGGACASEFRRHLRGQNRHDQQQQRGHLRDAAL